MKIKIHFGLMVTQETTWYDSIDNFPPLLTHKGIKYELLFSNKQHTKPYDYILTFVELQEHDMNYHVNCFSWEGRFASTMPGDCQCGAAFTSFTWDHMRFCAKWVPWDRL